MEIRKGQGKMKRTAAMIIALMVVMAMAAPVSAKGNDLAKAKAWSKVHYKGKIVKVVDFGKVPKDRAGKVYIEKLNTISKGGHSGRVKGTKYVVGYPKKVKKGKRVKMYLVYNPNTNYCDDVVAVAACGRIW